MGRAGSAPYVAAAVERECDSIAAAGAGGRNNALNRAAFNLGTIVGADRLDAGEATRALLAAVVACGLVQDDGQYAVLAIIESGLTSGAAHPREMPERKAQSVGSGNKSGGGRGGTTPGYEPGGDDPGKQPDNLPNVVRIVSAEWTAWLRLARKTSATKFVGLDHRPSPAEGGGCKSPKRTHTQVLRSGKTGPAETAQGSLAHPNPTSQPKLRIAHA